MHFTEVMIAYILYSKFLFIEQFPPKTMCYLPPYLRSNAGGVHRGGGFYVRVARPSAACGRASEGASKCRGRQEASLLCEAMLLPGTTNGAHRIPFPVAVPCVRLGVKHLRCTQTAATRSGRCIRHRRRSHRSPYVAFFGCFLGETRKYRPRQGPEVSIRRLPRRFAPRNDVGVRWLSVKQKFGKKEVARFEPPQLFLIQRPFGASHWHRLHFRWWR